MLYRRLLDFPAWRIKRPGHDLDRVRREMSRLFDALSERAVSRSMAGVFPLTNVTEDNDNYYVRAELPGLKADDLDIQVTASGISISGERKIAEEGDNVRYHRREREAGKFSRSINLADDIDVDNVDAKLESGVLTVTIPKAEKIKPRQITVK